MGETSANYNLLFWAKRLLNEDYGAENCGDHCMNSCRWCGLRNAVAEAEATQGALEQRRQYQNEHASVRGGDDFGESEPPEMMGTEALGNGNDHFGVHEQNEFCARRGCVRKA